MQCFPFGGSPEDVYDFKHECGANLRLLVMKVVFLSTVSAASANQADTSPVG